ncbi:MAG: hypothetical protein K6C10_05650 [Prevotella sp.]|nr:hypothetical protein [Prevotella sp.]
MTLKDLLSSVSSEDHSASSLFQQLLRVKPEYGSGRRIEVKQVNGKIAVSNVHVGSLGDVLTYPIDVAPDLQLSDSQLLDAILAEISLQGFGDAEQSEFWNEMTNLQKAKIVR